MRPPHIVGAARLGRQSRWRVLFGATEAESELVVALMCAQLLGYDGATCEELRLSGISANVVMHIRNLERRGLVEIAGTTEELPRRKVWRATGKAFTRFGVAPPAPASPTVATDAGRSELMRVRMAERHKRSQRRASRAIAAGAVAS